MAAHKTSGQKGVPVTEKPGKTSGKNNNVSRESHNLPKVNTKNNSPQKVMTPTPKLSPLEEWKAGRVKAIGNSDWYVYDSHIRKLVSEINQHLSKSKNISNYQPLDWKLIKAMIWTETGATSPAWKSRPIQIGNRDDAGIYEVTKPARPIKYHLIVPDSWDKYLINKNDIIKNNPEYNIRAGVALLMIKMSNQEDSRTIYDNNEILTYEVVKGDRGYDDISKKVGTTRRVLVELNGNKIMHPGDKIKYKKAHIEQYIPGWLSFTPENIRNQYNIDPAKSNSKKAGDKDYAEKIKFVYNLIIADENK